MTKTGLSTAARLLAATALACAFAQPALASVDVNGVKFEDTDKVAGKDLKLNGAGMRTKFIVKVYAAGLYLPEKKNSVPDILKMDGPRRMTLVMQRDVSSEDFAKAFMDGMNANTDKAEQAHMVSQINKFGEMFVTVEQGLKKGDVLHLDFVPGSGTICELNGKKLNAPIPDVAFYNAVLRIWLGEHPADHSLKPALLGQAK